MRNHRKTAAALVATALLGVAAAGTAQASSGTAGAAAPSACRPANHLAKITPAPGSAGHHHYRVTLTAPRGYQSCELAGSPIQVRFSQHGVDRGITAGRYGEQGTRVTFGPGHPVHFDVQIPSAAPGTPADEASFTLRAPGGEIPGTSVAAGALTVAPGTLVGPVRRGA
ncbi:DUF4232 domain-containing protein [Streptomyces sp. NPDC004111]|uniref:DUF4232 domain-containing protein n=1 Tax=Streptomyces sp. NPDC004111 TaxID=3364690 RepID=UPI0036747754